MEPCSSADDELKVPRALACLHTFCTGCITQIAGLPESKNTPPPTSNPLPFFACAHFPPPLLSFSNGTGHRDLPHLPQGHGARVRRGRASPELSAFGGRGGLAPQEPRFLIGRRLLGGWRLRLREFLVARRLEVLTSSRNLRVFGTEIAGRLGACGDEISQRLSTMMSQRLGAEVARHLPPRDCFVAQRLRTLSKVNPCLPSYPELIDSTSEMLA